LIAYSRRRDALGPAPRAELFHVLKLPDFERANRIGEFGDYPESRAFAELLIDCEEDRTLRALLVLGEFRGAANGFVFNLFNDHAGAEVLPPWCSSSQGRTPSSVR
jgi:hypothetical protein